jgi:hypothetical protein
MTFKEKFEELRRSLRHTLHSTVQFYGQGTEMHMCQLNVRNLSVRINRSHIRLLTIDEDKNIFAHYGKKFKEFKEIPIDILIELIDKIIKEYNQLFSFQKGENGYDLLYAGDKYDEIEDLCEDGITELVDKLNEFLRCVIYQVKGALEETNITVQNGEYIGVVVKTDKNEMRSKLFKYEWFERSWLVDDEDDEDSCQISL